MMRFHLLVAAATSLINLTLTLAAPAAKASMSHSCSDAAAGEFAECLGIQASIAEIELRGVFKALELNTTEPTCLNLLKIAQSNWTKYRDAECKFVSHDESGSYSAFFSQCHLQLTEERITNLRESKGCSKSQAGF
jgi:uncharacterized protein YecT (DUF1311 family)